MGKRVLVIGGGASGLAAAAELAKSDCEITLLEAAERLGGRILTRRVAGQIPELGAEFVHGRGHGMMKALHEAGLELSPVSGSNQVLREGKLEAVDIWTRVGEILGKIDAGHSDEAFASYLARQRFSKEEKEMATAFVEGFNASDAKRIGAHALLRAEYSSEKEHGDRQARVKDGYTALVEDLARRARESGATIRLNAKVQVVQWKAGTVSVQIEGGERFEAEAAVITISLGALKRGIMKFEPALVHKREAIDQLQFGNVVKCVFVFRRTWWDGFGFIHDFSAPIPSWWSDSRGPVIVGWAAGPKADALLADDLLDLKTKATEILARILRTEAKRVEQELAEFLWRDWSRDEFIGGVYGFIPVNGLDLPKLLAAPVEHTLFFAGEATAMDAQMGTVSGALESGLRTAHEVILSTHA